jgi:ligand-binding sensor domain-containing protein
LEGCSTPQFCLDCGEPKASVKAEEFRSFLNELSEDKDLKLDNKRFAFQMYLDSVGSACAISYDGNISSKQAKLLATKLSEFKGWTPAIQNGKGMNVSILVAFDFTGSPKGGVQRLNFSAMEENMNNPGTPEIQNKKYKYKNQNLKDYEFTVWNKANSSIPYDMSRAITVDKHDVIWHGTDNALVRFYNDRMEVFDKNNSLFKTNNKFLGVSATATDTKNVKWFDIADKIYRYDGERWEVFDSAKIGISGTTDITATKNGKVLFSSFDGLLVEEDGKWNLMTTSNSKLPSNEVSYANIDTKGRWWIGTYKGSILIEKDGSVTKFNDSEAPLKNLAITDMTEDANGNLWFATYDYDKRVTEKLVKLTASEEWSFYDINNSGLPENHINKLLSDNTEDILWITVHNVGLVRFDKKDNWQVYTNKNSDVPSTYIFDMEQDSKGNIWCATFSGLLRVSKKK